MAKPFQIERQYLLLISFSTVEEPETPNPAVEELDEVKVRKTGSREMDISVTEVQRIPLETRRKRQDPPAAGAPAPAPAPAPAGAAPAAATTPATKNNKTKTDKPNSGSNLHKLSVTKQLCLFSVIGGIMHKITF